jgi:hypothetical protein
LASVIQLCDQNFISRLEATGDGIGQDEIETRHIGSKRDGMATFCA